MRIARQIAVPSLRIPSGIPQRRAEPNASRRPCGAGRAGASGPGCGQNGPQEAHLKPFWPQAHNVAKKDPSRLI
jgi:hypothetical protein